MAPRRGFVRRPANEMADLVERLYEGVRANPGATMIAIAAHVGKSPRALHRPMFHLKRAGKVRSAGQRQHTRYFPMTASRSS
jgi:predicted transcriptional regulator